MQPIKRFIDAFLEREPIVLDDISYMTRLSGARAAQLELKLMHGTLFISYLLQISLGTFAHVKFKLPALPYLCNI